MKRLFLTLVMMSQFAFATESQILPDTFLRNWNVHSRVYIHWLGDLTVTTNKIIFSESGSYDYEILDIQTNECVLNVLSFEGTNRIFRLGPIKESTLSLGYLGGTQMSVTSYASKETAFAPREDDWDNCMSAGYYNHNPDIPSNVDEINWVPDNVLFMSDEWIELQWKASGLNKLQEFMEAWENRLKELEEAGVPAELRVDKLTE